MESDQTIPREPMRLRTLHPPAAHSRQEEMTLDRMVEITVPLIRFGRAAASTAAAYVIDWRAIRETAQCPTSRPAS